MYVTTAEQSPVLNNNGAPAFLAQIQGGIGWALDQYRAIEEIKAIRQTPQEQLTANKYQDNSAANSSTTVAQPTIAPDQRRAQDSMTVAGVTVSKPVLYVVAGVLALIAAKKYGVL
ncbi:hypothetical protein [Arsukibacterium sp.]|uniref:hypothetical protein n=1 Tax=Arsukibacterium sp. TaxID=1977258 RepID=UPI002FD8EFC2